MARRVALPESKLKRKRRIMRTRLAIVIGVALLLLAGIVIGLSWLPFIRIHSIEVTGAQTLATSTVEDFVQARLEGRTMFVFPRNNIFLYPKKAIRADLLAALPVLKDANVHAATFESVGVALDERVPVALWCANSSEATCSLMDNTGFVYAPDTSLSGEAFVHYSGSATTTPGYTSETAPMQFVTPAQFAALTSLVSALSQNQQDAPASRVEVDADGDVMAHFANGFSLIFDIKDAGADVYQRFTLALASKPFLNKTTADFDYLDLRFGDKLYYKER